MALQFEQAAKGSRIWDVGMVGLLRNEQKLSAGSDGATIERR